jgi:hypothetical protein
MRGLPPLGTPHDQPTSWSPPWRPAKAPCSTCGSHDKALTGAHTHKLGLSIVEAVRAVRAAANAAALPQLNALFGKQPPAPPPNQPPLPSERPSGSGPAAAPRPVAAPEPVRHRADDDESFEELDFLTDEEPRGGGRW